MALPTSPRRWHKSPGFLISTDKLLLSPSAINEAFDSEIVYWAKPVPEDVLQTMIQNSFCLGVYEIVPATTTATNTNGTGTGTDTGISQTDPSTTVSNCKINPRQTLKQIGFARLVGDMVTFAYVTDLYVLSEYQGQGLGGWLIDCIGEMLGEMPYLRWAMLRTSMEQSQRAYEKRLGMQVLVSGDIGQGPVMMGKKGGCGGP
ncbi:hypothetical protein PDE_05737 [Penicillium oxalicum 114-2]|uniref:N-acetyltransferase domain-containing protein n=1 Tax=Penicillium oxalicum (strain 114-2 / CGMCC 5302) TaxID=933388 RepID=S7ZJI6_PENO1|nr:hypothetical protein PDE_05737 [Penicillium oxalicum 114-2]